MIYSVVYQAKNFYTKNKSYITVITFCAKREKMFYTPT